MKLGAFIITFGRPEVLKKTLLSILAQTMTPDSILIVDNANSMATREVLRDLPAQEIAYHPMKENTGPAGASAFAFARMVEEGCDWIYWGDEDDPPRFTDTLERLFTLALTYNNNREEIVGAIAAGGALFDWTKGEIIRLPNHALKGILDVDIIGGSSQGIVSKEVIGSVGVPDARLFFGFYEPEYCLRMRRSGYRLLVDGDQMWKYRETAGRLQFQRRRSLVSNYTRDLIWRRYYRTRNYIFMMTKTFNRPDLANREALKAVTRVLFSWVRGPRYGLSFTKLQLLGIIDGYRARMGRTIQPSPKGN